VDLSRQFLFLISALGAFNGLFLSLYFAFFLNKKRKANYFLSALLFVLSIRIIKSVFFYFNPSLSGIFIQIGISAFVLIGPFLYLYSSMQVSKHPNRFWWLHVFPVLLLIIGLGIAYPYWEYRLLWRRYILYGIYWQWLAYIFLSGYSLRALLKKIIQKNEKLSSIEIWMVSVFFGVTAIWIGYRVGSYTSYIVGALSFSVVFYLLVLFFFIRRKRGTLIFEESIKYQRKKIRPSEVHSITQQLDEIMSKEKLYKNGGLKMKEVAEKMNSTPHILSEHLNNNLGKSFSHYINEYRVMEAAKILKENHQLTLEAIGEECGFRSNSTFYAAFKQKYGMTPAKYKKIHATS